MIQKARRFREMDMEPVSLQDQAKKLAEENGELTLLKAMDCILVLAEDSELSEEFWEASKPFANYVAKRMKTSSTQAVLLALLAEAGSVGRTGAISDIARYTKVQECEDDAVSSGPGRAVEAGVGEKDREELQTGDELCNT